MLTKERKGEIAYILLKHKMQQEGVPLKSGELKRSLGNIAKATGIDEKELTEFAAGVVLELVDETFPEFTRGLARDVVTNAFKVTEL